ERTGGREVHMLQAVGDAVGRAVVAGSNADGDAQSCGVLEQRTEFVQRLLAPGGFRTSPTDGDHRRVALRVVYGGSNGVVKALVGVGGEVNGESGLGGHGAGDFD